MTVFKSPRNGRSGGNREAAVMAGRKGKEGPASKTKTVPSKSAEPVQTKKKDAKSPATAGKQKEKQGPLALHMLSGELLVDDDVMGDRWYDCAPEWPENGTGGLVASQSEWATVAEHALNAVSRAFERRTGGGEDSRRRVLNKEKTVGDKIAAVTLMVQESPVHRLDELRMLLGFAKKQGRRERGPAIDALKDLFVNDLLPDERQLIPLSSREMRVPRGALSKRHLAYALFETELKDIFREFLDVIDECSKDAVVHFKQKAARVSFDLLVSKPENEKALLAMLVNELGSPERKVASSASYYLNLLLTKHHPAMKLVVVREVEQLVYRPNVGLRTRYYAISFLNQVRFSSGHDVELSRRLVRIYMELFAECVASDREGVKQKRSGGLETKESRLMGALLTGVNRAFPYSKPEEDERDYSKQFESLFQVAHAQSLASATQALSFLFHVAQSNSVVSDRFYRALYSRIVDSAGAGETKQSMFLNLIFKAMKADVSSKRVKAYSKRLLQAAVQGSAGFAAGALLVVSEVMANRRQGLLKSFVLLSEGDDADEEFRDVDEREEGNEKESKDGDAGTDSDADKKTEQALGKSTGGDGEERDGSERRAKGKEGGGSGVKEGEAGSVTWGSGYDPAKRDPLYARAEESCLWEIVALCAHYHPSVVRFAKRLREEMAGVEYKGDPLKDFTLGSFLDKFCYKKPKKHVVDSLHGRRSSRLAERPLVNSEEFVHLGDEGEIEEDEKFFLRFFKSNPERTKRGEAAGAAEGMPQEDADSSDEDAENEAFEGAMREEMKRLDAGGGAPNGGEDAEDDEVHAFRDAFEDELAGESSGDGSSSEEDDGMRLHVSDEEEGADGESESEAQNGGKGGKVKKNRSKTSSSVFAPVEDYEDVLRAEDERVLAMEAQGSSSDGGEDGDDDMEAFDRKAVGLSGEDASRPGKKSKKRGPAEGVGEISLAGKKRKKKRQR